MTGKAIIIICVCYLLGNIFNFGEFFASSAMSVFVSDLYVILYYCITIYKGGVHRSWPSGEQSGPTLLYFKIWIQLIFLDL